MKHRTKILLSVLLLLPTLLLGLLVGAASWLQGSEAGARLIVSQALDALEGRASVANVEGSLADGLVLSGVQWEQDGIRLEAPRAELKAHVSLRQGGVVIDSLRVQEPTLTLPEPEASPGAPTEPALTTAALLESLALPVPVEVRDLQIEGLRIEDAAGREQLEVDRVTARGLWHRDLEELVLGLSLLGVEVRATGRVALSDDPGAGASDGHGLLAEGRIDGTAFSEDLPGDLEFNARLEGDGSRVPFEVVSPSAGLRADGMILDPLGEPGLEGRIELAEWPADAAADAWQLRGVQGDVAGTPDQWRIDLEGSLALPEAADPVSWRLAGSGRQKTLEIELFEARANWLRADGTGLVAFGDTPRIEAQLSWRDVRWPPDGEEVLVASTAGQARLSGLPEAWTLSGDFDLQTAGYPAARVELTGEGDQEGGRFELLDVRLLGGNLRGSGEVVWRGPLRVHAELNGAGLDLAAAQPGWPVLEVLEASLNYAQAPAAASADDPQTDPQTDPQPGWIAAWRDRRVGLDLKRLEGRLGDQRLSGQGRLELTDGGLRFEQLELRTGDSWLTADGSLALDEGEVQRLSLAADLRAADLPPALAAGIKGELAGKLQYAPGRAEAPLRAFSLEAKGLGYGDARIATLIGRLEGQTVLLEAAGISKGELIFDESRLRLRGALQEQVLELALSEDGYRLELEMAAAPADWAQPLTAGWSGELRGLTLDDDRRRLLALRNPARLAWSPKGYGIEETCLALPEEGAFCLQVRSAGSGGLDLELSLARVPLAASSLVLDHDLQFSQYLDGTVVWNHAPGLEPTGRAAIEISAGEFGEIGDEDGQVATDAGLIAFTLDRGELTGGRFDLPFPGRGEIDLDFDISGVALDGTGRLAGELLVEFNDLSFLEALTAYYDNIGGSLATRLRLGGRVGDPALDGRFELLDLRFDAPVLGTRIREGELRGSFDEADELLLRGRFRAGEGEGRLQLLADFSDVQNPELRTQLTGEGLLAADLPDLQITVDPDVTLERRGGFWRIGGSIAIPSARVSPVTDFTSRVGESPDLQLVSGERTVVAQETAREALALAGELAFELGDDVRLEADLASVALGGGLNLAWRGAPVPFADGTVTVNGTATVWGPRLNIRDGRVRWPGIPVNNPVLDIAAEREVFGNTVVRAAGVRIGGTARRPDVEAFTVPYTTRERAWGVLITGSDVQFGQGVGALDVGTYIAPRIFLSYGISFFDNDNVVGIRYDLPRRGWGVKATSGQRESGVDLSYTIEVGREQAGEADGADSADR